MKWHCTIIGVLLLEQFFASGSDARWESEESRRETQLQSRVESHVCLRVYIVGGAKRTQSWTDRLGLRPAH